jgi:cytochrome c-type biogenesis protein CcmH/NrfG
MEAMTSHQTPDTDVELKSSNIWRRVESAEAAKLETEVETLREELASEVQNRKLRYPVAIGALTLMVVQVAISNAIFGWYGDTNAWDIPSVAISAWMGTTVVEVIGVVLVVTNYLFPTAQRGVA